MLFQLTRFLSLELCCRRTGAASKVLTASCWLVDAETNVVSTASAEDPSSSPSWHASLLFLLLLDSSTTQAAIITTSLFSENLMVNGYAFGCSRMFFLIVKYRCTNKEKQRASMFVQNELVSLHQNRSRAPDEHTDLLPQRAVLLESAAVHHCDGAAKVPLRLRCSCSLVHDLHVIT